MAKIETAYVRKLEAENRRFRENLREIAKFPNEDNEWDAVDKFRDCRRLAQAALSHKRGAPEKL